MHYIPSFRRSLAINHTCFHHIQPPPQARKYIPSELPLVNFFGWTLGGFYLARYTHSPVGAFDELVALAGLAWNFPTSCAWAARVYVNNKEARDHGISSVGLPSRLASFKAVPLPSLKARKSTKSSSTSWWDVRRTTKHPSSSTDSFIEAIELHNIESSSKQLVLNNGSSRKVTRGLRSPVCTIELPPCSHSWAPQIQMALPSFSGGTPDHPGLLKYSLELFSKVRFLKPVRVMTPVKRNECEKESFEVLDSVLTGAPLVCMAFDDMRMHVQAPVEWIPRGQMMIGSKRMHAV